MKKTVPDFKSDAEAEAFVDTADLSKYDFSQFKPVQFEFQAKTERVNMRLPGDLLKALRRKAEGMPVSAVHSGDVGEGCKWEEVKAEVELLCAMHQRCCRIAATTASGASS